MRRNCSYNPELHLIPLRSKSGAIMTHPNGDPILFLPVEASVDWFFTWCNENHVTGYIDDSDIHFEELNSGKWGTLCVVKSTVYIDRKIAGISVGSDLFY